MILEVIKFNNQRRTCLMRVLLCDFDTNTFVALNTAHVRYDEESMAFVVTSVKNEIYAVTGWKLRSLRLYSPI